MFPMAQDKIVASTTVDKFSLLPAATSECITKFSETERPSAGLKGSRSVCRP
jgi:hypothetical protein